MRILDRTARGGVFLVRKQFLQTFAKPLVGRIWVFAFGVREGILDATPSDILRKCLLFLGGRGTILGHDLVGEFERIEVGKRLDLLAAVFFQRAGIDDVVVALYEVCGSFSSALLSSACRVVCSWFGKSISVCITASAASLANGSFG